MLKRPNLRLMPKPWRRLKTNVPNPVLTPPSGWWCRRQPWRQPRRIYQILKVLSNNFLGTWMALPKENIWSKKPLCLILFIVMLPCFTSLAKERSLVPRSWLPFFTFPTNQWRRPISTGSIPSGPQPQSKYPKPACFWVRVFIGG